MMLLDTWIQEDDEIYQIEYYEGNTWEIPLMYFHEAISTFTIDKDHFYMITDLTQYPIIK